ncbi:MAG: amino acid adenylation domain-containing protein [Alteromonadaceae bacterium]|nr:amino acid adenylation domain-containing protein [Alteromonadaceae bacterium]
MNNDQSIPLHPAQLGIYYDQLLNGLTAKHNIGGYIRIQGNLDSRLLEVASDLCWRNSRDIRLKLMLSNPEPTQQLGVEEEMPTLQKITFADRSDSQHLALNWMQTQMDKGISLQQFPLFDHTLVQIAEDEHWYFMRQHHISADAYTFSLRISDLLNSYSQLLQCKAVSFPERFDFSQEVYKARDYQSTEQFQEDREYWLQRVISMKPRTLIANDENKVNEQRVKFKRALTISAKTKILRLAKESGVTLQHLILTSLSCCLGALNQDFSMVIGTPVHNRVTRKQKQMLGMFVTVVPTFITINPQITFLENAKKIAKSQNTDLMHRKYPWANLLSDIRRYHPERNRLFEIIFNYETFHSVTAPDGLKVKLHELSSTVDDTPLRIIFSDFGESQSPAIVLEGSSEVAKAINLENLLDSVLEILESISFYINSRVGDLIERISLSVVYQDGREDTVDTFSIQQPSDALASLVHSKLSIPVTLIESLVQKIGRSTHNKHVLMACWAAFMAKYERKITFSCAGIDVDGSLSKVNLKLCLNLSTEQQCVAEIVSNIVNESDRTFDFTAPQQQPENNVFITLFSEQDKFSTIEHQLMSALEKSDHLENYVLRVHQRETEVDLYLITSNTAFRKSTNKLNLKYFIEFLEQLTTADNVAKSLLSIPLASDTLQQRLLAQWEPEPVKFLGSTSLHGRFENIVKQQPDKPALVTAEKTLTYQELDTKANLIANYLLQHNMEQGSVIGLYFERNADTIAAILGILKAGCAYIPLDPNYPTERLNYLIEDSTVEAILSTSPRLPSLSSAVEMIQVLDIYQTQQGKYDVKKPTITDVNSQSLAYVIYTSGSTGNPKGVLQTHGNVCRLFDATVNQFNFSDRDVWTLFHSVSFDFSVWEIWGALLFGGKLVIPDFACTRTPKQFFQFCLEHGVTVLNQTPSAFHGLSLSLDEQCSWLELRYIICGGEALLPVHVRTWYQKNVATNAQLINMYGITETTVHVTLKVIESKDENTITIGHPINDQAILLLDEQLKPVPPGAVGEICVVGAGLALGYKNRPELTDNKFIHSPFRLANVERLYRSGDLARYDETKNEFIYVGRGDSQIKLHGFRIELGEVENQLLQHLDIIQTVVLVKGSGQEKFLVAYVVTANVINDKQLRLYFNERLPNHMLPRRYIQLAKLPLTTNGKLDRDELSRISIDEEEKEIVTPRNPQETIVLNICKSLLENANIGVESILFNYGWHSISAAQAATQIGEIFQVELSIKTLLVAPTISEIVLALEAECGGKEITEDITQTYLMLASLSDEEVEQMLSLN